MKSFNFVYKCLLFVFFSTIIMFSNSVADSLDVKKKIPFRVPKVNSTIKVDARLNEELWKKAVKIDANIEVRPGENIEAPVKTEVLIVYNDTHIFVAFIAYDPEPSKIRARYCDRDNIWDDDWVIILFDTFNDQRRTYDFGCNPLGIQTDFIETTTGGGGEWDAIWESDGRITDEGYIVEMAIPFSSLNFPRSQDDQIWGFDLVRSYPRNVRHHIGAFPRDRNNNCYMCQALKLVGFKGVSPGKNIEIDPTINGLLTYEREKETAGNYKLKEEKYAPGITAHWGITPNLTLSGTINPDFSNVEADVMQLDINNQFAIYYPEKRPFFLESSDFFRTPMNVVHTRTLADPDWGVKVSGKEGIHTVGYFTVQDQMTNFLFPGSEGYNEGTKNKRSFGSAFRYKMDVSKSSNAGLIATNREGENYYNRVGGIDGDFKFTKTDRFMFQVLGSQTKYPDSIAAKFDQSASQISGKALELLYVHETKDYEVYGFHTQVDKNFRSDLGFMSQVGYTYSEVGAEYKWQRDSKHWYNWLSIDTEVGYQTDYKKDVLNRRWKTNINYRGPMDSHSHLTVEMRKKRYNDKNFNLISMHSCYGFRPIAPLFLHIFVAYGDEIDYSNRRSGTNLQINPSLTANIGLHLKTELDYTYETLDVSMGRLYTANNTRLKLVYQLNKRIFIRAILQNRDYRRDSNLYVDDVNSKTSIVLSQLLFSYKINPQTVFYLGYSDNIYGDQDIDPVRTDFTIFSKIGYAIVP